MRTPTPWGMSDESTELAPGIVFHSTPSHGGFELSAERLAELTQKLGLVKTFCGQANWFEEDCDWAHVAVAFPEHFTADQVIEAGRVREWLAKRAARTAA